MSRGRAGLVNAKLNRRTGIMLVSVLGTGSVHGGESNAMVWEQKFLQGAWETIRLFCDQTMFSGVFHCTDRKSAIFLFPVYLT